MRDVVNGRIATRERRAEFLLELDIPTAQLSEPLDIGVDVPELCIAVGHLGAGPGLGHALKAETHTAQQVADQYHETCAKHGQKPGRLMCSYFTHFADTREQEIAQRARQIRYYKECVIPAFPGDPKTAPPSYRYFIQIVERLRNIKAEDLTENSVLLGSPAQITDTLKKVEAAGFEEVILYFNVGLKPHAQVKEEMDRFMRDVAPSFAGARNRAS